MSLTLNIGLSTSDYNRLDKNFQSVASVTAVLKDQCSVVNPVFIVNSFNGFANCNYLKCAAFGRNYYINNIETMPGGRLALHCHVDVLSSYAAGIRGCGAIIDKQQGSDLSTSYIDDGSWVTECKDVIQCYTFTGSLSNTANILITAGG